MVSPVPYDENGEVRRWDVGVVVVWSEKAITHMVSFLNLPIPPFNEMSLPVLESSEGEAVVEPFIWC
jgi:hypothetical protein